ncbi:hypothetical protein EJ07DRAFT_99341 [Lizonia empirigonia]|nr:hypothetical protein EJ07DRAFT_99341 [Lizonia empirigonia]
MALRYLLASAILAVTAAQQNVGDPIKDFCRRHLHQTCIIDSKLYIDGGKVYYGGYVDNSSVAEQNTRLLWENVLDTKNDFKFPPQYSNLTKDPDVPSVSGGVLWPDTTNKLFYLFAGEYDTVDEVQSFTTLWLYDVIYNTWNRSSASDGSLTDIKWPALGAGTVTDTGIAYYYGGYLANLTMPGWTGDRLMLNSMTSFNMNSRTWQNNTYDQTPRAEGSLLFIPASDAGMLVYFGGVEMNNSIHLDLTDMPQNIQLFDIANNRWFTQTATGDVPTPRRGSCANTIWAKDKSSYNFYVYGGITSNEQAVDELYILTLPSFQWTLVYPAAVPNYFGGKAWMSCNVIRDSQMLFVGGQIPNVSLTACDVPTIGGQHGLLFGQEATEEGAWWHGIQDNTTGYRVPDKIVSLVGGNTDGHATATAPAGGFAIRDLSVYFGTTASATPRTASRVIPASATATSSNQPKSKSNTGAIAGGVVGGIIALSALIGIIFFCLRHRRRNAPTEPTRAELANNPALDPNSPTYSNSMHSPMVEAPEYSTHADQYPTSTYYPPPPSGAAHAHSKSQHVSHELPSSATPAAMEMPQLHSPVPKRVGY